MKKTVTIVLSASNMLSILAMLSLTTFCLYASTGIARDISSAKVQPRIQNDDTDIAPPMNPDNSQDSGPRDLDDPVFSPGSAASEPDSLTDQPDSGINEEGSATEPDDDTVDELDAEADEPQSADDEPDPVLNQEQPETVVPAGSPPGDGEAGGD
jgi:hypothetical protein